MEERELTRLLQRAADRVTPGPPPLRRIVDAGEALRGRRSGRVRRFAVAAVAAAAIGGGAVAATVLDLPSGDADQSAGSVAEGAAGGADEGATAADAGASLAVTPDAARTGEVVELDVPPDVPFGVEWLLERSVAGAWRPTHVLVDADFAASSGTPLSRRVDAADDILGVAEVHDAPVPLIVPDDAPPGRYLICQTVDDGTEWCGELTVTG